MDATLHFNRLNGEINKEVWKYMDVNSFITDCPDYGRKAVDEIGADVYGGGTPAPGCRIGYTQGVFDMFHIGHLNLLKHAKEKCDYLIVGVNKDSLVYQYKHKTPVVAENERLQIVSSIRFVDRCVLVDTLDKVALWEKLHFDSIFIGDDWKGNARWMQTEKDLATYGVKLTYLPYTKDVSSTMLRGEHENRVEG